MGDILVKQNILNIINSNVVYYFKNTDDLFSNWIADRIIITFKPYLDLPLIYNIPDATDIFDTKLWEHIPDLFLKLKTEMVKLNKDMFNENTIGKFNISTISDVGYSGFDTQNQDNTFQKNNSTTSYAGNQTIQYLAFFETGMKNWCGSFKNEIINTITQTYYS